MAAEDRPSEIREVGFKQRSTVIGAVIMHGASDLSVGGPKAVIVTETHNSESTQEYTEIYSSVAWRWTFDNAPRRRLRYLAGITGARFVAVWQRMAQTGTDSMARYDAEWSIMVKGCSEDGIGLVKGSPSHRLSNMHYLTTRSPPQDRSAVLLSIRPCNHTAYQKHEGYHP